MGLRLLALLKLVSLLQQEFGDALRWKLETVESHGGIGDFPVRRNEPVSQTANRDAFEDRTAPAHSRQFGIETEDVARITHVTAGDRIMNVPAKVVTIAVEVVLDQFLDVRPDERTIKNIMIDAIGV